MGKELNLPRRDKDGNCYLSHSQIKTWKKSKREYIRQYFLGEDNDNKGLQKFGDFGHLVGEAFENNDFSAFEPDEVEFLLTIPQYDEFERKIRLDMDGFYLLGYIDTSSMPKDYGNGQGEHVRRIADYKTGDIIKRGEEYSSDDYLQVEIYAAALEQEFGVIPEDCKVYLIGRSGNAFKNEALALTKEFVTISRDSSPERIQTVKDEVQAIAEEISEYYEAFLKVNQII